MDTFFFRFGLDFIIILFLVWLYLKTGRTKAKRRQRIKILYQQIAPTMLLLFCLCNHVIPGIFGSYFLQARYLPQIIEAHKLRFYWSVVSTIPYVKPSPKEVQRAIDEVAREFTMHPDLIRALVHVESSSNQFAISSVGACGLTQIMPNTYYSLSRGNPFALKSNLRAGTRYIRQLYRRFDGNLELALAAYNAGPTTISRRKKVPAGSVRRYVDKVIKQYHQFKNS